MYGNIEIFTTPIYKGKVPNYEDLNKNLIKNDVLKNGSMYQKESYHGKFSTSFATSDYGTERDTEHLNILIDYINNSVKQYVSKYTLDKPTIFPDKIDIQDIWFNSCKKGEYQESHNHLLYREESPLSFIYYLKLPEGTNENTVFINDLKKYETLYFPQLKLVQSHFIPRCEEGDFIIFPSFIEHYVRHNTSNEERLTIAGNIFLRYPEIPFASQ